MTFNLTTEQKKRLEKSKTFAEALGVLKDASGGTWDTLGAALGTDRYPVIRWSKGAWPRDYVETFREIGVPSRLLQPGKEIQKRLLRAEAEIERIRELLR